MKKILTGLLIAASLQSVHAQVYVSSEKSVQVSFFSSTPVEDISAKSATGLAIYNATNDSVAFRIANTSFDFPSDLMEEHFNEKYMESDKYRLSSFRGKVNQDIDVTKDGVYKVTVTGYMDMHGKKQLRTFDGTMTVKSGTISIDAEFDIPLKDYDIKVPTLVIAKIAKTIKVTIAAKLAIKKAK